MKKIIKKTDKEREEEKNESKIKEVKVKETGNFYYVCDKCEVAFFDDDIVLKRYIDNKTLCQNVSINLIGKRTCRTQMYGGDEKTFNELYKIKQS